MLTIPQASKLLGIPPVTLRRLCRQGRVAGAVKPGRDWFVPDPPEVQRRARGRPKKT